MTSVCKEIDVTYPCLMKCSDVVVLFNKDRCGVVVYGESAPFKLGDYSDDWIMSAFEKFSGTLTLKNE